MAQSSRKYTGGPCRGYSLLELLVVMGIMCVAIGSATALLLEAREGFGKAIRNSEEVSTVRRGTELLLKDIRKASSAQLADRVLTLRTGTDTEVIWEFREAEIRRTLSDNELEFPGRFSDIGVVVNREGRQACVEVRFWLEDAAGKDRFPFYLAARLRKTEATE